MQLQQLFEGASRPVILVDFQEAYSRAPNFNKAFSNVASYLKKTKPHNCLALFNNEDLTGDTVSSTRWFYIENGVSEDIVATIEFRDKYFAFLRSWMDQSVPDRSIIAVVRYMVNNRLWSSEEISSDTMRQLVSDDVYEKIARTLSIDSINIPGDISIAELKQFSGCLIGGGARHQCLREITLLLNAFNIKYTLVENWIY